MIKIVDINKVNAGMLIGKTIYDNNGRILIRKDQMLSKFIIDRLKEYGFDLICIEDEIKEKEISSDVLSEEIKNKITNDLRNINILSTIKNAQEIVDSIFLEKNLSFETTDIRNKDNYIFRHSVMVAEFSVAIGTGLQMNKHDLLDLAVAALLHDLGKMCINRGIMAKFNLPDDVREYQDNMHSAYAYNMLYNNSSVKSTTKNGILFHHKNEDGSGYPKELPAPTHIFAKIIHVADCYDNLISCKDGNRLTPAQALEYIFAHTGNDSMFNYDVVNIFKRYIPIYPKGMCVKLSNEMNGIIIDNKNKLRPIVRISIGKQHKDIDLNKILNITIVDAEIDLENDKQK